MRENCWREAPSSDSALASRIKKAQPWRGGGAEASTLSQEAASFVLALVLAGVSSLAADTNILAFADHLFRSADYYRAITEYERFAFLYPDDPLADAARFRIALCYVAGQKPNAARPRLLDLVNSKPESAVGRNATLLLADLDYRSGNYAGAAGRLEEFLTTDPDDPRADGVRLRLALCRLRAGETDLACRALQNVPPDSEAQKSADLLMGQFKEFESLSRKSPGGAAVLSALAPGLGQLYVGRKGDAFMAFLMNALFIGGAVAAFHNDEPVAGSVFSIAGLSAYAGSIANASVSARKINRSQETHFFQRLHLSLGFGGWGFDDAGRPGIGWRFDF